MPTTALLWFRRDLRLDDNPALARAVQYGERLLPLYVHAPGEETPWAPGAAARWWLHHSLAALDAELRKRGSRLVIAQGDSLATLRQIAAATGATHCFWNRVHEPQGIARDRSILAALRADGLHCETHNAALLFEPTSIQTGNGGPYRVFTAYWRRCQPLLASLPAAQPAPAQLPPLPSATPSGSPLDALALLPDIPWDQGLRAAWQPGEAGAQVRLETFAGNAEHYAVARDRPDLDGTSRLSPHLHWGEIGPRQVVARLADAGIAADGFVRELGWREFSHHLLQHFPHTPEQPLDPAFGRFPWRAEDPDGDLSAWQRGRTGIPIVDAGMRELWHTGWMHNRVRMIVASLLTKNLLLPWLAGARWFWDTLVDADLANNTQGWQWSAGCGADAAPYFRIFNPVRQGERFDPNGDYVRHWCPELAALPAPRIHCPWLLPTAQLQAAGIELGRDYPRPIVDLATSRQAALAAWQRLRAA